jgi:hypothetical protein
VSAIPASSLPNDFGGPAFADIGDVIGSALVARAVWTFLGHPAKYGVTTQARQQSDSSGAQTVQNGEGTKLMAATIIMVHCA